MSSKSGCQNQKTISRKSYTSPRLVIYGAVRDLTQSGTGLMTELTCGFIPYPTRQKCSSERRVKEHIVRIGDHPLGFGLYLFDYRPEHRNQWGHGRQFGVMIDDVERVMPEAVSMHTDGYKRVDYSLLGIHQYKH